jgi:hypothetical protein
MLTGIETIVGFYLLDNGLAHSRWWYGLCRLITSAVLTVAT